MSPKTFEQEVQTIGPGAYVQLVPQLETVSLISEIQSARKTDEKLTDGKSLRDVWLYGGDGVIYGLKGEDVFLYLTDADNNPGLENPKQFAHELKKKHYFLLYPPKSNDLETKAINHNDNSVIAFNLSELERQGRLRLVNQFCYDAYYIDVKTQKLAEGKEAFKKEYGQEVTALFDRVHGESIYGKDGIGALLSTPEGENITSVLVPSPYYVKKVLKRKEQGTMFARASELGNFGIRSMVALGSCELTLDFVYLRGIVKKSAEGGVVQNVMPHEGALKEASRIAPKSTFFNSIIGSLLDKIYRRK